MHLSHVWTTVISVQCYITITLALPTLLGDGLSSLLGGGRGVISVSGLIDNIFNAHDFMGEDMDDRVSNTANKINPTVALDFLETFGYESEEWTKDGWNGKSEEQKAAQLKAPLKEFQRKMEIDQTGVLDEQTKREMAKPRCAFPDIITPKTEARTKRFVLGKTKWDLRDMPLTIAFTGHSNKMGRQEQEDALMAAANEWARISGLRFLKGNQRDATINIDFTNHDGPWGVLGKAWFPKVGRILFEKNEIWTAAIPDRNGGGASGSPRQTGLAFYSVALHELGHALGISHSNVRNAIMHGQYQRDVLSLQSDDIRAATKLYGESSRPTRVPKTNDRNRKNRVPTTTRRPSNRRSRQRTTTGRPRPTSRNRNNRNNNRRPTNNRRNPPRNRRRFG